MGVTPTVITDSLHSGGVSVCDNHNDHLHTLGGIWVWRPQWSLTDYILLGVYGCGTHSDHCQFTYSWGYMGVTPPVITASLHTLGGIWVWHPQWSLTDYILLGVYGCDTHSDHWQITYSQGYMSVTPPVITDRLHTLGGIWVWHPQWSQTDYILLGVYGCNTHSHPWQL